MLAEDELDCTIYQNDGAVEMIDSPLFARDDFAVFNHRVIGFNEIGSFVGVVCRTPETG